MNLEQLITKIEKLRHYETDNVDIGYNQALGDALDIIVCEQINFDEEERKMAEREMKINQELEASKELSQSVFILEDNE